MISEDSFRFPRARHISCAAVRAVRWAVLVGVVISAVKYTAWSQTVERGSAQANPTLLTSSPPAGLGLGPVDWVFVVDTSASMSGREHGAPNIFPLVQNTLTRFVPGIRNDDTLTLIVFDESSRVASAALPKSLTSRVDREALLALINRLTALGPWTHTGAALTDALNQVYSRSDENRPAAIILLTDGHEDVRGVRDPIRIPDAIRIIRDEHVPYVFYVSLGTTPDPRIREFLDRINQKAAGHGVVFDDPGASHLPKIVAGIRDRVGAPIQIAPTAVRLGAIRPGTAPHEFSVDVLSPVEIGRAHV